MRSVCSSDFGSALVWLDDHTDMLTGWQKNHAQRVSTHRRAPFVGQPEFTDTMLWWQTNKTREQQSNPNHLNRMEVKVFVVSVCGSSRQWFRDASSCLYTRMSVFRRSPRWSATKWSRITSIYDSRMFVTVFEVSITSSHRHPTFYPRDQTLFIHLVVFPLSVRVFDLVFCFEFFYLRTASLFVLWRTTMTCILWMLIVWIMCRVYVLTITSVTVYSQVY